MRVLLTNKAKSVVIAHTKFDNKWAFHKYDNYQKRLLYLMNSVRINTNVSQSDLHNLT
jgi:hypothetical protein